MTFPSGTFPTKLIPPYGQVGAPPAADTNVTPASVLLFNIWLLGFAYLPVSKPNLTAAFGNNHTILVGTEILTLNQTFDKAVTLLEPSIEGGIGFTVDGIGNIHMDTNATNTAINFTEPE